MLHPCVELLLTRIGDRFDRNDPSVMKRRMFAVSLCSVTFPFLLSIIFLGLPSDEVCRRKDLNNRDNLQLFKNTASFRFLEGIWHSKRGISLCGYVSTYDHHASLSRPSCSVVPSPLNSVVKFCFLKYSATRFHDLKRHGIAAIIRSCDGGNCLPFMRDLVVVLYIVFLLLSGLICACKKGPNKRRDCVPCLPHRDSCQGRMVSFHGSYLVISYFLSRSFGIIVCSMTHIRSFVSISSSSSSRAYDAEVSEKNGVV